MEKALFKIIFCRKIYDFWDAKGRFIDHILPEVFNDKEIW